MTLGTISSQAVPVEDAQDTLSVPFPSLSAVHTVDPSFLTKPTDTKKSVAANAAITSS